MRCNWQPGTRARGLRIGPVLHYTLDRDAGGTQSLGGRFSTAYCRLGSYHSTYAATWVGTELRWDLAADEAEVKALLGLAEDCPNTTAVYETAP
ncbi:hypothetical protein [Streptomyces sp. NPDC059918]|uniref:hypothetical protein n=1 Tax=unclassified Streptomyces TaxID=2593676 RepID=UPI0036474F13